MDRRIYSPQYTSVQRNYEILTRHLQANKEAKTSLTSKYISKGWLDHLATPSGHELVSQVLVRIEGDPIQYDVFISMLKEITGTNLIVQKLTGKYIEFSTYITTSAFLQIFIGVFFFWGRLLS